MAYVKTVWQDGDIILPEKLNNMENGIEANDQKQGVSFDDLFPVGAFWWSTVAGSPAAQGLSAGTWEQIKDTFLLAAGDSYTSGATGGAETHTLTVSEIPPHQHSINIYADMGGSQYGGNAGFNIGNSDLDSAHFRTDDTGGGQAFSIMPPYLAAYCWHRVA